MRAALMCLALLTVASPSAFADRWEREYRVGDAPELTVTVGDAKVEVETWDRPAIGIEVVTQNLKIGTGVRVRAEQAGDRVTLDVREPRMSISIGFRSQSILVTLRVPRAIGLDVRSGDGPVTLPALEGRIHVATGDGPIVVDGLRGDLSLSTGDGSIRARDLEGSLAASTGDGRMEIGGRFDRLDLETGDGAITADLEVAHRDRPTWSVSTGDGPVLLRLPEDFRADIDAHSGDGRIDIDFPLESDGYGRRSSLRGAINGGGPALVLRSGDGAIKVRRL